MTTTGYEASHNTRIHDRKLNQLINIVRQFSPKPGLPGSDPFFLTERKMLSLEVLLGTRGEKTNVSVRPSVHPYFAAYLSHIVLAVELRRASGTFSPPFPTRPRVPQARPDHAWCIIPSAGPLPNGLHRWMDTKLLWAKASKSAQLAYKPKPPIKSIYLIKSNQFLKETCGTRSLDILGDPAVN